MGRPGALRGMWGLSVLLCCSISKHCWQVLELSLPALLLPSPCYSYDDDVVVASCGLRWSWNGRQAAVLLAVMVESCRIPVVESWAWDAEADLPAGQCGTVPQTV